MTTIFGPKSLQAIEVKKKMGVVDKSMLSFPQMKGFLGTGATFGADLNLVVQFAMGVALLMGALLAKQKHYRAHGICQTSVLLLNLVMIALVMWPSFHQQVGPVFPRVFRKRYFTVATIHAALGTAAELLGFYIILVAGTNTLPQWLRFKNWKLWMRAELILGSSVLLSGTWAYYIWYIAITS
jgi:uncharacterized membrane protein YozB (DUF420 family)